jgi:putative aldouronate transport system permease protein
MGLFAFTMYFTGGMIPTYLLVKNLGMLNTMWALVLPSAVSTYNLIIMRTFFQTSIPDELVESAAIDGCNDLGVFFRIVVPLAAPIFVVMVLFYGVSQWNSWFPALLYISDRGKYPLQMILREILIQSEVSELTGSVGDVEIIGEGLKYATMVVATLPIMCLYPFLQKYFVKGVMIGAVKG